MNPPITIDVTFDFRQDTPPGADPDALSPTLRRYHWVLWSKNLPSGATFTLDDQKRNAYLYHQSPLGEFFLASDAVIPSFRKERSLEAVFSQIPTEERDAFLRLGYTIGGMMVLPSNRVDGQMTINGARGCHPRIKDRFDLTVECIRRHYAGGRSPLSDALARYNGFFRLFESFKGYVEFFLLQDLTTTDFSKVRFLAPFTDFADSPVPATLHMYRDYRDRASEFIVARNSRISRFYSPNAYPETNARE